MKRILNITILTLGLLSGLSSCQDYFLDLDPQDALTDAAFFKKADDFKNYSANFYNQLMGWRQPISNHGFMQLWDTNTDITTYLGDEYPRGNVNVPASDARWNTPYSWIRSINIFLQRAEQFSGDKSEISKYVAEARFFRANAYNNLLTFFGGVPIVSNVLDVNSPQLTEPRNSRYEVVDLILSDLTAAIAVLPTEKNIAQTDKGRISKEAAQALKAKILLNEATWRKYVKNTTDFQGSTGPKSDQIDAFLSEAVTLTKDIMDNGGYELWNYNSALNNEASYYFFILEDAGSNPAGLTKATNKEHVLYGIYDFTYRQGGAALSHMSEQFLPSRKMMDMYLCTDGLPAHKSPLFKGYHNLGDEYQNRDLRMAGHHGQLPATVMLTRGLSGYPNRKFFTYKYGTYRASNQESPNYPIIRLADVYLMYAEALWERNGQITDAQLNESVNKVRARAGVAPLTISFAAQHGLNILEEVRNERVRELYMEGSRLADLKRWGIAEEVLGEPTCGQVVGDANYTTPFRNASGNATANYNPASYVWGEATVQTAAGALKCVVVDGKSNRNFKRQHYLLPLPSEQLVLNPNLKQNPGYN